MRPKISAIVPVYGVESYLAQCVESILSQTLADLEVILVDDGSPDSCGAICDGYARQDYRVRVIHQKNSGLGPARNAGLETARGEYVAFVDSDDWVKPALYEKLYAAARQTGADITVSGHRDVAFGRVLRVKPHPLAGTTLTAGEIAPVRKKLFGHGLQEKTVEAFPMSVCMSLYRRELLEENRLRFPDLLSEDTLFNLAAYGKASCITFTADTDYCYRKEGQSSITQSFSKEKCARYQDFLTALMELAEQEDGDCVLRAKRTAIGYGRLYAAQVDSARLPLREKCRCVREFAETIRPFWEGYPVENLPLQQRLFHRLLTSGHPLGVLALCRIRKLMKKGGFRHGKP